jgi:hypothetical protein
VPKTPRRTLARLHAPDRVRVKLYPIVHDKIETALEFGWSRAHKHTVSPGENYIKDCIHGEVMGALCDLFDFDPEPLS